MEVELREKRIDEKFCADCGAIINAKAEICPKCGVRQLSAPMPATHTVIQIQPAIGTRDKNVAGVLAILFGGLGIHKFYMGRPVWGIIFFIFCWTFIPMVISFIEGIALFFLSKEEFDYEYNNVPRPPKPVRVTPPAPVVVPKTPLATACPHCGGVLPLQQETCNHCGNAISWINGKARRPSRLAE